MTFEEKLDRLGGVFAYDTGCLGSGIKDDAFKASLSADMGEFHELLTFMVKTYLNCNQGYNIEDVNELLEWAKRECNLEF